MANQGRMHMLFGGAQGPRPTMLSEIADVLYQINLIRSFLIAVSIARHGDLALQIPLIAYKTSFSFQLRILKVGQNSKPAVSVNT